MSGVNINMMPTTNAGGGFFATSDGYIGGFISHPDPTARAKMRVGTIAPAAAPYLPGASGLFYGGIAVQATTRLTDASLADPILNRAQGLASLTGFSVFDKSAAGVQTPQSPCPLYGAGQALAFFDIGSGAVIALPISNANAAALLGAQDNTQLSWDFTNDVVIPYTAAGANAGAIPGSGPGGVAKIIDFKIGTCKVVVTHQNYNIWGALDPGVGNNTFFEGGSVVCLQI